jgi:hypothetical protein
MWRSVYVIVCCMLVGGVIWIRSGRFAEAAPFTYVTVDHPSASGTYLEGISDGQIIGNYYANVNAPFSGFVYSGGGFSAVNDPNANSYLGTRVWGISGNEIVGDYLDSNGYRHGYTFDGNSYQTLDNPLANLSFGNGAGGISGNKIVGFYNDSFGSHGYVYDGTSFVTLDDPQIPNSIADAIDGTNILGGKHSAGLSYLYDGTTFKTIVGPPGSQVYANGISGNLIVGDYSDGMGSHGFIYEGSNYTTIDIPGAVSTSLSDIEGNTIVGSYYSSVDSAWHGVIITIPEPASVVLMAIGGVIALAASRRHRCQLCGKEIVNDVNELPSGWAQMPISRLPDGSAQTALLCDLCSTKGEAAVWVLGRRQRKDQDKS